MKDISTTNIKFKKPHLYKEDLVKIEKYLLELEPRGYTIEVNKTQYDNFEEVQEKTSNDLTIQTSSPYVRLELYGDTARIYSSENDLKVLGAIYKITEVIKKRERKFLTYLGRTLYPFLVFSMIGVSFTHQKKFILSYLILFILFFLFSFYTLFFLHTQVDFAKKSDRPNFFQRNRDPLFINLIVGIIVALITYFLTK